MHDFITIEQIESILGLHLYVEDIEACGIQSSEVPGKYPQGPLVDIAKLVRAKCAIPHQDPTHGSLGVVLHHYLDTWRAQGVSVSEEVLLKLVEKQRCVRIHGNMHVYHFSPMVIEPPHIGL